ncbi:retinol dehydrogenase 14 [Elysia marginata]|uniref:Retinol dehydrogenase 14 n=1 Tax=Elysia marginata TaxID=1093978 RepID=A0AAV4IRV5_9GAST|nr:retinol dehydrogenase 14 [Elysia marginata]
MSSKAHGYTKIKFDDLMSEKSYSPLFAYCQSKLANLLHALELSKRLEGTGVTINCVHPGFIATELQRHYSSGISKLFMVTVRRLFFDSPEIGAQTTLYCAVSPEVEGVSGRYFA